MLKNFSCTVHRLVPSPPPLEGSLCDAYIKPFTAIIACIFVHVGPINGRAVAVFQPSCIISLLVLYVELKIIHCKDLVLEERNEFKKELINC